MCEPGDVSVNQKASFFLARWRTSAAACWLKAVVAVEAVLSVSESSDWAVLCLRSVVVVTEDGGTAGEGASEAAAASSSNERIFRVPTACAMAASGELTAAATAAGCWRGGVVTTAACGAKGAAAVAANSPARPAMYGCWRHCKWGDEPFRF